MARPDAVDDPGAGPATRRDRQAPTGAPVEEPALRKELLARLVQDQAVRTGVAPAGDDLTPTSWRPPGTRPTAVTTPGWRRS